MTVQVATGFVPIHGHPRSPETYRKLGLRLCKELQESGELDYSVMALSGGIESCWMHQWISMKGKDFKLTHSTADNPNKNTRAYHIVQHDKVNVLKTTLNFNPGADVYVWIDFGILHLPNVNTRIILDFLRRVRKEKTICMPGCWGRGPVDDAAPCWRFCGGLIVVPREYVIDFDALFRAEAIKRASDTRNLTWEVNTLARLEQSSQLPIWWYKADHNETMFTAYPEAGAHA